MSKVFHALPVQDMVRIGSIATAKPMAHIGSDDSAIHLLTDFTEHKVPALSSNLSVSEARLWMKLADTPVKLVENQAGDCLGLLTIQDVNSERPMMLANRYGVALDDLRGLISARELAQRLDLSIDLEHRATRFYEIVSVVQGGV
ncbi:hypothetical protein [Marinobacter lutaoensis]|jgi:hypothetical protein|uniref:hypothetical protein n=1 Tax=Marinobacter lutaoensis TaxID=135739 RepID=UPI00159449D7|nr:hypothetical protein [Marinobacter lutaoensis]NVD34181.1 hypothetical protein [Marinobacter lutaoensis]